MVSIILALIWFTGILYWNVDYDYKKISQGIPIDHKKHAVIRAALLVPSSIAFLMPSFSLLQIPIVICMQGAWWWEFFDGWLNSKRGYPWRFNGGGGEGSADSDNFLRKFTPTQQALIKWGLIVLFTTIYIITL